MKRILLLILMLILFTAPCALAAEANVYENPQYKFRINVPDGWQIKEGTKAIVEINAPADFPSMAFFAESADGYKITSDEISQEIEAKISTRLVKDMAPMVLTDQRHIKIANHDALQILFINDKVYYLTYFFFNNDRFFMITAFGSISLLGKDHKNFKQIISSFTFID